MPGPPDFDTWRKSWMVFKRTMILLKVIKPEPLDAYVEHIRSLYEAHGQAHWFIIQQADIRAQLEMFELWLHQEEIKAASGEGTRTPSPAPGILSSTPWPTHTSYQLTSSGSNVKEVQDKVSACINRTKSYAEIFSYGPPAQLGKNLRLAPTREKPGGSRNVS
jgi:hypothetical protein